LPYDKHSNPAHLKGVIFDTNRSYNEDSIWYMCENSRVAAFGGIKGIVHSLRRKDIVFLYHKGFGIVAAGRVRSDVVRADASVDGLYHELEWLTPVPTRTGVLKAMPPSEIQTVMKRNFWWAKTMKAPFLDSKDTATLLEALEVKLS
jgi:hypothetical protein